VGFRRCRSRVGRGRRGCRRCRSRVGRGRRRSRGGRGRGGRRAANKPELHSLGKPGSRSRSRVGRGQIRNRGGRGRGGRPAARPGRGGRGIPQPGNRSIGRRRNIPRQSLGKPKRTFGFRAVSTLRNLRAPRQQQIFENYSACRSPRANGPSERGLPLGGPGRASGKSSAKAQPPITTNPHKRKSLGGPCPKEPTTKIDYTQFSQKRQTATVRVVTGFGPYENLDRTSSLWKAPTVGGPSSVAEAVPRRKKKADRKTFEKAASHSRDRALPQRAGRENHIYNRRRPQQT